MSFYYTQGLNWDKHSQIILWFCSVSSLNSYQDFSVWTLHYLSNFANTPHTQQFPPSTIGFWHIRKYNLLSRFFLKHRLEFHAKQANTDYESSFHMKSNRTFNSIQTKQNPNETHVFVLPVKEIKYSQAIRQRQSRSQLGSMMVCSWDIRWGTGKLWCQPGAGTVMPSSDSRGFRIHILTWGNTLCSCSPANLSLTSADDLFW